MPLTTRHFLRLILAAALIAEVFAIPCALQVAAQDPFGAAPASDPFGKASADPAKGAAAAIDDVEAAALKQEPLAIQQFREANPTTPEQIIATAQAVLQFGRPDECKRYLARFLGIKPDDAALAALETRFGGAIFLRFSQEDRVQPEGKQVAELVLGAAQRIARDTARLDGFIKQLSDADPYTQGVALARLQDAGPSVVTLLLRALSDAGRESEHKVIRSALVALGPISEAPLLGALDTPNDYLRPQVIAILGKMQSRASARYLIRLAVDANAPELDRSLAKASLARILGSMPTRLDAEQYLFNQAERLPTDASPFPTDAEGMVTVWYWDASQNTTLPRKLSTADAALALAARLAEDVHTLAPQNGGVTRLWLLRKLELAQVLNGLAKPIPPTDPVFAAAKSAGPQAVNDVLATALKTHRAPAAIAAAQVLGAIGDATLLQAPALLESPLTQALRYPDRRVRFQAALAIVRLNPRESFPGASRVAETLGWLAANNGTRRALVAHPRGAEAQSLVGFLNELGYEADGAYTGRALMDLAVAISDYELVLLSDAIDRPHVQELVQLLRKDYRTAELPIGVMARGEAVDNLRDLLVADRLTGVFPRIHDADVADLEVRRLVARAGRNITTRDERLDQAAAALDALVQLASSAETFALYDLPRQEANVLVALNTPSLSTRAAVLLGIYGSARSQSALVDFASQSSRPLVAREAAARAFAAAVQRRGTMLTTPQIELQFNRYNLSETADPATQAMLGSILDAIEARAAVTQRN